MQRVARVGLADRVQRLPPIVLDGVIVASALGMVVVPQFSVPLFHLVFFCLLLHAFGSELRPFLIRSAIAVSIVSGLLYVEVRAGFVHQDELTEIPMMTAMIVLASAVVRRNVDALAVAKTAREFQEALFQHAHDGVLVSDERGRVALANAAAARMFEYDLHDLVDMRVQLLLPELGDANPGDEFEIDAERRHGARFPVRVAVGGTGTGVNKSNQRSYFVQDISEQVEAEEKLVHAATHDGLTGLKNRDAAHAHLESVSANPSTAVLLIDLDGFKLINDTYGHDAGDRVLTAAAARIADSVRRNDIAARIGGDEFIVIMADADEADARIVARRIVAGMREPIAIDDSTSVDLTASVGISLSSPGIASDEVLLKADRALYAAKDSGRDTFELALAT